MAPATMHAAGEAGKDHDLFTLQLTSQPLCARGPSRFMPTIVFDGKVYVDLKGKVVAFG
jgi:hypothetical protein